ncbi:MAG: nucleoside 2-deoxyribosyltransferase [Candidatus Dormibacteraeota bacterium]|nr:nucleoside 2-deoxyribosyltransferase [Candidatus Dormibacteraeota bacterium]MBO0761535.1 nucleoside 2-deoxyribosyltransferase [Candidatus Dormibacteraeota bacterium]
MFCYFAAPLFSAAERSFNAALTARLEELGVQVFLPQRDGAERDREPYTSMAPEEWRRAVFELDRDMVLRSDLVLCVLDGRTPDEGVCVELGIAYAHKWDGRAPKTIIGLLTDRRAAFLGEKLNPMVARPLDHRVESEEDLLALVQGILAGSVRGGA